MYTRANTGAGGGKVYMGEFTPPTRAQQTCLIPTSTIGFVPTKVVISTLGECATIVDYNNGVTTTNLEEFNNNIYNGNQSISVDSTGVTFFVSTMEQRRAYIMCAE